MKNKNITSKILSFLFISLIALSFSFVFVKSASDENTVYASGTTYTCTYDGTTQTWDSKPDYVQNGDSIKIKNTKNDSSNQYRIDYFINEDYGTDLSSSSGCVLGDKNGGREHTISIQWNNTKVTADGDHILISAPHTIKYDLNGGSGTKPNDITNCYIGDNKTLSNGTGLTKAGCTFKGWGTSSTTAVADAKSSYTVKASDDSDKDFVITLYAVWEKVTYSIVYDANGGTGTVPTNTTEYTKAQLDDGLSLDLPDIGLVTKEGYKFIGWNNDKSATSGWENAHIIREEMADNRVFTLYAIWEEKKTITIDQTVQETSLYYNGGYKALKDYIVKYTVDGETITDFTVKFSNDNTNWHDKPFLDVDGSLTVKITRAETDTCKKVDLTIPNGYIVYRRYFEYHDEGADSGIAPDIYKTYGTEEYTIKGNTGNLSKNGYKFGGWICKDEDGDIVNYSVGTKFYYSNNGTYDLYPMWVLEANELTKDTDYTASAKVPDKVTGYQWYKDVDFDFDKALEGQTNSKLGDVKDNNDYYCGITYTYNYSKFNFTSTIYTNKVTPKSITLDKNGGTGGSDLIVYQFEGRSIEFPTTTYTKDGYKLLGFNTDKNATDKLNSYTVSSSNATLYAIWQEKDNVSIIEDAQTYTFNGSSQKFELKGTNKDLGSFIVNYYVNNEWTTVVPTNAGKYNVKITRAEDNDYNPYTKEINNGLVISPYEITIIWEEKEFYYNKEEQTVKAYYKDINNNDVELNVTYSDTFKEVGEYTLTASFKNNETNYKLPTNNEKAYTINNKTGIAWWGVLLIILAVLIILFVGLFFIWKLELDKVKEDNNRKLKFLDVVCREINKVIFKK